jgi:fucose 4-O-acetylase-like acetyltransferase
VFGYVVAMYGVLGFAGMNTACIAQLYILIGYLFKKYENRFKEKAITVCSVTGTLYAVLGIYSLRFYPGQTLDVHENIYYNVVICGLMILCGCIFLLTVASKMEVNGRVVAIVGRNTLVFYMLNSYAFKIIYKCMKHVGIKEMENPISWLLMCVVASIICGALAIIINRYFPKIVGKKRNKSNAI